MYIHSRKSMKYGMKYMETKGEVLQFKVFGACSHSIVKYHPQHPQKDLRNDKNYTFSALYGKNLSVITIC